jgi:hypothetical protein
MHVEGKTCAIWSSRFYPAKIGVTLRVHVSAFFPRMVRAVGSREIPEGIDPRR